MSIEFCPLQPTWGTWGEWFGGVVAFGVGLAVLRLGTKANDIATSAQRLATESDRREARLLLIYISSDVASTLSKVRKTLESLNGILMDALYISDKEYRGMISREVIEMMMGTVEKQLGRLHVLDKATGDALAKALGAQRTAQIIAFFGQAESTEDRDRGSDRVELIRLLTDLEKQLTIVDDACKTALAST